MYELLNLNNKVGIHVRLEYHQVVFAAARYVTWVSLCIAASEIAAAAVAAGISAVVFAAVSAASAGSAAAAI